MAQVRFVVLTSSRTGSTWFIDLLNLIEGVKAYGELFLNEKRTMPALTEGARRPRYRETCQARGLRRIRHVYAYLDDVYQDSAVCGFKLMYTQLRGYPEIAAYLLAKSVRVVHLVRTNLIDVLVSEELARMTGTSHAKLNESMSASAVWLDPSTLITRIRRRERAVRIARRLIRVSRLRARETTYENLMQDPEELPRICSFLNIRESPPLQGSSLAKRGSHSHPAAIRNFEQIAAELKGSPYYHMLRQ